MQLRLLFLLCKNDGYVILFLEGVKMMKKDNSKGFMVYLIIALIIIIIALVFLVAKAWFNKGNNEKDDTRNIVIEGVWKAKYMELGTDKSGKEYYIVFNKDGKVYAIDEDSAREGSYSDTNADENANFAMQIDDEPISLCKYENDDIQCELYDFIEKVNIKREK